MDISLRHLTSLNNSFRYRMLWSAKYKTVWAQRTDVSNPPASVSLCRSLLAGFQRVVIQRRGQQDPCSSLQPGRGWEQRVFWARQSLNPSERLGLDQVCKTHIGHLHTFITVWNLEEKHEQHKYTQARRWTYHSWGNNASRVLVLLFFLCSLSSGWLGVLVVSPEDAKPS